MLIKFYSSLITQPHTLSVLPHLPMLSAVSNGREGKEEPMEMIIQISIVLGGKGILSALCMYIFYNGMHLSSVSGLITLVKES